MAKKRGTVAAATMPQAFEIPVTVTLMPANRLPGFYQEVATLSEEGKKEPSYRLGMAIAGGAFYVFTPFRQEGTTAHHVYVGRLADVFQAIAAKLDAEVGR